MKCVSISVFPSLCVMILGSMVSAAIRFEQAHAANPRVESPQDVADGGEQEPTQAEKIEFHRIKMDDYANFPVNWSAKGTYRLGLIRSADEYSQVFQPAAVAGNRKPFAPNAEFYDKEMVLIVGRVTPAPGDIEQALVIEQVIAKGKTLEVIFRFRPGPASANYSVKAMSTVRIPVRDIERVIFREGETKIDELKIDQGQWLMPVPAAAAEATTLEKDRN